MSIAELRPGIRAQVVRAVTGQMTAASIESGAAQVLSTPHMIALMEAASLAALAPYMDEGSITVGIRVDVEHLQAAPVGMEVEASAVLTRIEGRKLYLDVEARCGGEVIGRGAHERFIVDHGRFMARLRDRYPDAGL